MRRRLRRRVIASTSVPLSDRLEAGTFDDRLFYRLNAIHIVPTSVLASEQRDRELERPRGQ
jgi:DNA-binding NtrC family response regulator